MSFSLYETSHGDILGDSNVGRIGGSKGGGRITFGELLDLCGTDRESVDPRFLSFTGVGLVLASFAGVGKSSFCLEKFAAAWKAAA